MGLIQNKILKDLTPLIEDKFNEIVKTNQENANNKLIERLDKWDEMVKERIKEIIEQELDLLITNKINSLVR